MRSKAFVANILLLLGVAVLSSVAWCESGNLRRDFYKYICPSAESTVEMVVKKYIQKDITLAAPLPRLHFHDCFVRGCDGSILLNSTKNNQAEKDALPNLSLRGFEVIDDAKAELENICPGVVSCADIVALVARDAVVTGSKGPFWQVQTGRRDGTISSANKALKKLPSPFMNFAQLKDSFAKRGLSVKDLVVLSGGHTIGVGHCNSFSNRLYNFTGKGDMDPSLDKSYAEELKTKCKSLADFTTIVPMDPGSDLTFDSDYFSNLKSQRGLFQSDAALLTNSQSKYIVDKQLKQASFFDNFKISMQRMGEIGVLCGSAGEIRKHCAFVN